MDHLDQTAGLAQVSQDYLEPDFKLANSGLSPDEISSTLKIKSESIHRTIASGPMLRARVVQQLKTHKETLPSFIFSYRYSTDQLYRTDLVTGAQSTHKVTSYQFKIGCCLTEVPGGGLFITGGGYAVVCDAVSIDSRREFAVSLHPPMLTPRKCHAAVYRTPHLYILGGHTGARCLSECERYACAENQWKALPPLPRACSSTSGVVVEKSLYALGGLDDSLLDSVQKLSLESLTWELMQLRLPHPEYAVPVSK
jgi:hypothetical protein